MGATDLRKIQIGRESTRGTGVAAAAILSGITDFTWNPGVTIMNKKYLAGNLAPATKSSVVRKEPTAKVMGDVTPEDLIYFLDSSVKGTVSPSGAGPYVYTFTFPTTADPAIRYRTWEFYDGAYCYELNGGVVNKMTFKGADGTDNISFEAELFGTELVQTTVTGSLSARSFTLLPSQSCSLYIDAAAGTIGSTAVSNTLIEWEYTFEMNHHQKFFKDGGLTATGIGIASPSVTLKTTFEYNASAHTQVGNYIAGTQQLFRITGTNPSSYSVSWDMGGTITSIDDGWSDRDGNTTIGLTAEAVLDSGAFANYAKIIVTNGVSAFVTNA